MRVSIVMGSKSDFDVVRPAVKLLDGLGIERDVRVLSAHRTPAETHAYVERAERDGTEVFIGVAGKAAHLAGVIAAYTALPVVALPVATSMMGGLDSLLSMVQMPAGVPVATVAINGAKNAALIAVSILALSDGEVAARLDAFRTRQTADVLKAEL